MDFLEIFIILLFLIFVYFIMKLAFKIDKKIKKKKIDKGYLVNDKTIKFMLENELNITDRKFDYEYLGRPYLEIDIEESLGNFQPLKNRFIKNIEKDKIAKTNRKNLISCIETYIKIKNKEVENILMKLKEDKMITLEEFNIVSKEIENGIVRDCENSLYSLFEYGALELHKRKLITDEEFMKRKRFFYGDEQISKGV
ncbi:hypothetical protein [Fusobacterium gastrosuis]|uniref:hypothetical protein n=1 Tax=Fusobacterium gastrosuis TaxID=1755100 RepID=UPI0029781C6C|nr:hypothetical protein [Fusobacteriaceae bacterium]MDY5712348.1 hypothetical protein [Fusobacterium gastrosuis]